MRTLLLLPSLLAACDAPAESAVDSGSAPLALTDEANASLSVSFELGHADIQVDNQMILDWSSLTTSLGGGSVPDGGYTDVDLYWFSSLTEAEFQTAVLTGSLSQSEATGRAISRMEPGQSSRSLADLSAFSGPSRAVDFFATGEGCWVLLLSDNGAPRWATFLTPVANVPDRRADLSLAGGHLSVSATEGTPVSLPPGDSATIDWSALTVDMQGKPWTPENAHTLVLARFPGEAGSVAADVLAASRAADAWYEVDVYGDTTASIASAVDGDAPFPGVKSGETWALVLQCDTCLLQLPVFATQLIAE